MSSRFLLTAIYPEFCLDDLFCCLFCSHISLDLSCYAIPRYSSKETDYFAVNSVPPYTQPCVLCCVLVSSFNTILLLAVLGRTSRASRAAALTTCPKADGVHPNQAGKVLRETVSPVFESRTVEKGERVVSRPLRLVSYNDVYSRRHSLFLSTLYHTFALSLFQPQATSHTATMRSPAIVLSVVAVAALSPTILASPLPTPALLPALEHRRSDTLASRGLGFMDIFARAETPKPAPTSKPKVAIVGGLPVGYAALVARTTLCINDTLQPTRLLEEGRVCNTP